MYSHQGSSEEEEEKKMQILSHHFLHKSTTQTFPLIQKEKNPQI